jgi:hypothetical protein
MVEAAAVMAMQIYMWKDGTWCDVNDYDKELDRDKGEPYLEREVPGWVEHIEDIPDWIETCVLL